MSSNVFLSKASRPTRPLRNAVRLSSALLQAEETARSRKEHESTLMAANNYAITLVKLQRYTEVKSLLRRILPIERRVHGEDDEATLKMLSIYAEALYRDDGASLDDVREAVTTLEDAARIARRVLGVTHPTTTEIEDNLRMARAKLPAQSKN